MYLHQILITDNALLKLPKQLEKSIQSIKKYIAHTHYHLYSNEELIDWIYQEYGMQMLQAYHKLTPYAYKADLARYLLLYKLGGWYADVSLHSAHCDILVNNNVDMVVFSDLSQHSKTYYACANGLIYSKPNTIVLEKTIEQVYHNIRQEFYGKNSLYPTGPACFGKNVALYGDSLNVVTGSFISLTPEHPMTNRAFVLDSGEIIAFHLGDYKGGNLTKLDIKGTNNYQKLYEAKAIYDKRISL